jgi:hypothetical protein
MNLVKPLFMAIAIAAFQVSAETAYRSIDEQGNVTFSDKPVSATTQTQQISIDAPVPSVEVQKEAQQREAELQKAASQAGTSSTNGKADQKKAARQDVKDAEKHLEEATQVREGDRLGTAGGGSRLTPEYQERVRGAEAEVGRAVKQLEDTK